MFGNFGKAVAGKMAMQTYSVGAESANVLAFYNDLENVQITNVPIAGETTGVFFRVEMPANSTTELNINLDVSHDGNNDGFIRVDEVQNAGADGYTNIQTRNSAGAPTPSIIGYKEDTTSGNLLEYFKIAASTIVSTNQTPEEDRFNIFYKLTNTTNGIVYKYIRVGKVGTAVMAAEIKIHEVTKSI